MYENLLKLLKQKNYTLSAAESCTGGMVAAAITDIPGISEVFYGSVTAYDNSVKIKLLAVPEEVITKYGAVSEECAAFMASGVAQATNTKVSVSTTGIAGPTGGVPGKPVGTVCFGYCIDGKVFTESCHFSGNRQEVRTQAANHALQSLTEKLCKA